jgi:predicted ABC-type transport system involved in lysophospholipase L1 biosynthesis ATPase subunit
MTVLALSFMGIAAGVAGAAVIIITHDPLVGARAHRLVKILDGRIEND